MANTTLPASHPKTRRLSLCRARIPSSARQALNQGRRCSARLPPPPTVATAHVARRSLHAGGVCVSTSRRALLRFCAAAAPGRRYPRLLIENRIYSSRVFRKLHLEVACRQDGLQVLHMVMYPRYSFDLPIFAMDIVVAKG